MDDIIHSDKVIGGTTPMSPCKNCRSPGLLPRTSAITFRFDLTTNTNALILISEVDL